MAEATRKDSIVMCVEFAPDHTAARCDMMECLCGNIMGSMSMDFVD